MYELTCQNTKFNRFIWFYLSKYKNDKNPVAVMSKVLLKKVIKEILIKNELLIHSESISFEIWKEKKYYFFQKQFSYLTSITLLHFQSKIIVFCAKYWPIFPTIRYVYDAKSPYFVEKNDIYLKKNILCARQPRY